MVRRLVVLAALATPSLALGQQPELARTLTEWRRSQHNVVAYIEAMPDTALAFRPTPGVRTFAEQFDHIVTTNLEVAAAVRGLPGPPPVGDRAQYLRSKSALRAYADATYAYMLATLTDATPELLQRPISVYGAPAQPALRFVELSLEHSVWTLGQVVPYLRLNGVTPPPYDIPF